MKHIDIFKKIIGKNYSVCYRVEKNFERWISGELINYNSGNIILYDTKNEVIYHIPFCGLEWMIPIKKKENEE